MSAGQAQDQAIVYVSPDEILVPEERVTSMLEEEKLEELRESIKKYGILQPIQLARVDGKLVLIDGLHRLKIAKELKLKQVPAVIRDMSEKELLITNLIVNRQRGKSNPAHEAMVLKRLIHDYNMSMREAAEALGMSTATAERYYQIATAASPKTLELLEKGELSVGCAYYLSYISDKARQDEIATHAAEFNYSVEQCRAAAIAAEHPQETAQLKWAFTPEGKPQPKPVAVYPCGEEVPPEHVGSVLIDRRLWPLIEAAFKELCAEGFFRAALAEQEQQPQQAQPQQRKAEERDYFAELLSKI